MFTICNGFACIHHFQCIDTKSKAALKLKIGSNHGWDTCRILQANRGYTTQKNDDLFTGKDFLKVIFLNKRLYLVNYRSSSICWTLNRAKSFISFDIHL